MFRRVAIAGVGLIGASLGMALKRRGGAERVVGVGRTIENLRVARARGAIDGWTDSIEEAARGADLVVLATPIERIVPLALRAARVVPAGAVLTDVGSVKAAILRGVEPLLPRGVRFVGGHPIAGTEERGAAAANADLFQGHRCVLTPTPRTDRRALARVRKMWEGVGMEVSTLSPAAHDRALAAVSHLPHVAAFALARAAGRGGGKALALAGPSFRDMTRVAASDPNLWAGILDANRSEVRRALARFLREIREADRRLARGDGGALRRWIEGGRRARGRAFPPEP